ncbi:MAG TPA: TIGR01777 family oxidoreductase [Acidimicrobiales bacterium]|nr:TIGR01777 family oxidoreductase [Acidimicrobiales bacterium]
MKVVLAGGTGSLGRRVADHLAAGGHDIVILTRSPRPDIVYRQVRWDERWMPELQDAVLMNLAGELVDRRPTPRNIELLRRSRVEPTRALVDASQTYRPRLWLQMSTLAIYGDGGDALLDERARVATTPPQMAGVATAWEAAADGAGADRLVVLRTGVVLDRDTPALDRLEGLTRWGLGGRIGNGRQWVSWLHADDFLAALDFVIAHHDVRGVVHVTSPEPVRNADMMRTLRRVLHRPWSPPTPTPLVRLGAFVLRTDPALALIGRRAVPAKLLAAGFAFSHPDFEGALRDLVA